MRSITSVTAVFALVIPGVFNSPQIIQGYSTDDMFDLDTVAKTETRMGVDGRLSGGYVIHPRKMKIKLEADSSSQGVFDAWAAAMDTALDAIPASATITVISNGSQYTLTRGFLTGYKDMPDAKKTLQPLDYEITWESITKVGM